MNHENSGRLTVDPNGKWQLYAPTLPPGAVALGTVRRENGDEGALIRFEITGRYAQLNAGAARTLDGRKVAAALGHGGRPVEIGVKRVNVTLDNATIERAREIGAGNLSEGLRRAVAEFADPHGPR